MRGIERDVIVLLVASLIGLVMGYLVMNFASVASIQISLVNKFSTINSIEGKIIASLESFSIPESPKSMSLIEKVYKVSKKCKKDPINCADAQAGALLTYKDYERVSKESKVNIKIKTIWEKAKLHTNNLKYIGDSPEQIYNNIFRYGKYMSGVGSVLSPPVALAKMAYDGELEKIPVLSNYKKDIDTLKRAYEILKSPELKQNEKVDKLKEIKFAESALKIARIIQLVNDRIEDWKENPTPLRPY